MPSYQIEGITIQGRGMVSIVFNFTTDSLCQAEMATDQWVKTQSAESGIVRIIQADIVVSERKFHDVGWTRWILSSAACVFGQ
jgi:metal-sulfur cluster biosynthetic enzyme